MQNEFMLVVDNVAERQQNVVGILKHMKEKQPMLPEPIVFQTPGEAIAFSANHVCPVVFAAVPLPGMNSLTMIEKISEQSSNTNFILLADEKEYIIHVLMMNFRPSGCIVGMPDYDAIQNELDDLRFPLSS